MKRRTFARATLASLCAAGAGIQTAFAARPAEARLAGGEIYELRTYTLKSGNLQALDAYLAKALLPALKRAKIGPVGVFTETENTIRDIQTGKNLNGSQDKGLSRVVVLIPHATADSALLLSRRLEGDQEYQDAARGFLGAKAAAPVYERISVSLLGAIAGMPKMETPNASQPRLFNLRIYESHNERAAAKKVEMFERGEIEIFKKTGLTPVFFASGLTGPNLPNLTYLLVFPDDKARKGAWSKFVSDPEWKKMSAMPEYADKEILSRITNLLLTPREYSEI